MLVSSRITLLVSFLAALLVCPVLAIYYDEANNIDFHYALVGQPLASNTFFHQPVKSSKASLLYTLSDRAVLAAVNPKDGVIVWRQQLSTNSSSAPGILGVGIDQDVLFTAIGSKLAAWSAADGRLAWHKDFAPLNVQALAIHDSVTSSSSASQVFVSLSGGPGEHLRKIDPHTGKTQWAFRDQSGDIPHSILTTPGLVHFVSLRSALLKGLKLKIISFDVKDGSRKNEQTLGTDGDIKTPNDLIFAGSSSNDPLLAWTDAAKKTLKLYVAGASNFQSFDIPVHANAAENVSVHTAGRSSTSATPTRFIVQYQSSAEHWADVFEIDSRKPTVRHFSTLASVPGKGAFSVAVSEGKIYFVRITDDQTILLSSDSEAPIYKWDTSFNLPGLLDQPSPVHAAAEVVIRSSANPAVRAGILLSTGDWVLIRNGETVWFRPEALAGITDIQWAELAEKETLSAEGLKLESSGNLLSNFWRRTARHLNGAQGLSLVAASVQSTVLGQLYGSSSTADEAFGFNKLVIVRTTNNRLMALDMGDKGRIVWNLDGAGDKGKCFVGKNDKQSIRSQLECLGQLPIISEPPPRWAILTRFRDPFLKFDQEDLQPSSRTAEGDQSTQSNDQLVYSIVDGRLRGYRAKDKTRELWTFQPPTGHRILSVGSQLSFEPVASIGKALADRRVLYKYLNPSSVIVITVDDDRKQAVATVVDTVSGGILYSSRHEEVDTSRPISSVISENWMAFSYTIDPPQESVSKGFQLVVAEFYESRIPNDRGVSGTSSNFSALAGSGATVRPHVFSQSYHIPEEITQMVVTQTSQGITSRQLVVGLEGSNSIVGIPRYVVDPRRMVGKEPSNDQRYEEALSQYSPMIDFDAKWYLNHREEIFGLDQIRTAPSLLESTSLVFAYGLDIFGTRVAPSFAFDILGTEFNKIQLVLTIVGLLAGVFVVAPMITRKQTNALWQPY